MSASRSRPASCTRFSCRAPSPVATSNRPPVASSTRPGSPSPSAAITGTFFGVRSRLPTGDLVINGRAIFANADGRFTPGLFARIRMVSAESQTVALAPDRAVATDLGKRFVVVVNSANKAEATITPAMTAEDFPAVMQAMAQLRAPIDAFFTAVQVNADNQIVRRNRLNLLHRIRATCSGVADLTKIEG